MSKESFEGNLSTAQVTHIVGGTAEQLAEMGEQVSEHMETGEDGKGLMDKVIDRSADALKHAGANSDTIRSVASGAGGSLLIAGGLFTTMKGLAIIRNASGLRVTSESVEKALDHSGVSVSEEKIHDFHKEFKAELKAGGICNGAGFVESKSRSKDVEIGPKFADTVMHALAKSGIDIKNQDLVDELTKSLAADLGFIYSKDDKGVHLASYDGTQNVTTNAYTPSTKDLVSVLGVSNKGQSEKFEKALDAGGIIEDGRCVKSPTRAELSACYSMAGIAYDDKQLDKAQKYFDEKSRAVAEVPTLGNRINMNAKMEGGLITTMGMASLAAGVLVLLASFAGIAGLAVASFGIALAGLTATATLVARDTVGDIKEGLNNKKMMETHKGLSKDKSLSPEQRLEHSMQGKSYENKAKQSAGVSVGNSLFMTSVALTLLIMLTVLTGGVSLGMLAMVTVPTFAVGAAVTIYTKKTFGKEVDNVNKDIKEFKALQNAKEKGDLTHEQTEKLEALKNKYEPIEKPDVASQQKVDNGKPDKPELELAQSHERSSALSSENTQISESVIDSDVPEHSVAGELENVESRGGESVELPEEQEDLSHLLENPEFKDQLMGVSENLHDGGIDEMRNTDHVGHSSDDHDESVSHTHER